MKISILFAILICNAAWASPPDWNELARNLRSENSREATILSLRQRPNLEKELRAALKQADQVQTAAEVIEALKLKTLAPDLAVAVTADPSGRTFALLLALDPEGSSDVVQNAYKFVRETLGDNGQPAAIAVAALERLNKIETTVDDKKFETLLKHPSHEVRMALVRRMAKPDLKMALWKLVLQSKPYQVRSEALGNLLDASELPAELKSAVKAQCESEHETEIKAICSKLGGKYVF